jgi:hypothetical protein
MRAHGETATATTTTTTTTTKAEALIKEIRFHSV